MIIFSTRSW